MVANESNYMDTLVSIEWLSQHLSEPDLVVLDCTVLIQPGGSGGFRINNGRVNYDLGHIPGAVFADLLGDLSDRESPVWMGMPSPELFCSAMGALGVDDDSRVVLYDSGGSMWAARVWWMLRWAGFDRAAILDGGLKLWKAGGHPLSTEPTIPTAKTLTLRLRPDLIASRDVVFDALGDSTVTIIDSLDANSYRSVHIPGAVNIGAYGLLDETGRYLSADELARPHPGDRSCRAITYCGGGVAACSTAFVMSRLGFNNVAVYAASMQEWISDPANPLEGEDPAAARQIYSLYAK